MTAANPDRWAAPNYASFTGTDATPLQQTFQSLSTYLEKINNSVTIASGTGVTSLVAGTNITLSGATGAVTISVKTPSEFVTVAASGRAIALTAPAGDATPAILQFTNNAVNTQWASITATSGYINLNASSAVNASSDLQTTLRVIANNGTSKYITIGDWQSAATYGAVNGNKGYLLLSNTIGDEQIYLRGGSATTVHIGGSGSNTLSVGNNTTTANGALNVTGGINGSYVQAGATGVTYAGSISATNWFRPTGTSGLYFESYGGGWHMTDTTWIRSYNSKNVYMDNEVRIGNRLSGNVGRQRGSYGSISFGGNGATNVWDGIEWTDTPQTLMLQGDFYSGMYRNNNAWNWLWNYSTLVVGSDIRYKRDIQPLNIGLKFIKELEPISYLKVTERPDDDPDATEEGYYYGFSAQNVRAALDACGETRDVKIHDIGGPNMGLVACVEGAVYDRQYLGVTEFLGPIVLAIKELEQRVSQLEGTV